jgi:hypothetical protein
MRAPRVGAGAGFVGLTVGLAYLYLSDSPVVRGTSSLAVLGLFALIIAGLLLVSALLFTERREPFARLIELLAIVLNRRSGR